MPIAKLFIEGALESQILLSIFQGTPTLQQGGSKNGLRPRTRTERHDNQVAAGYLRDRDFDYDPPEDLSQPTVDFTLPDGTPIGWRWCRHEIENYLIDPAIVNAATGLPNADIEEAIRSSAKMIRDYEAARWTVGNVRRGLPPHYELATRPNRLNEIALPTLLDPDHINAWATSSIETHRGVILEKADPTAVKTSLDAYVLRFDDAFLAGTERVLIWFSGKDILAGMVDWIVSKGFANPGEFRAAIRDWMREHPDQTLDLLPEWRRLTEILRA